MGEREGGGEGWHGRRRAQAWATGRAAAELERGSWRRSGTGGEAGSGAAEPRGGRIRCHRAARSLDPLRGQGHHRPGGQA
uniref:Uncharacterized protein n=1 Tax=Oryza barthii TaxID=65489 RepID=A0A0D3HKP0_9ORYZ